MTENQYQDDLSNSTDVQIIINKLKQYSSKGLNFEEAKQKLISEGYTDTLINQAMDSYEYGSTEAPLTNNGNSSNNLKPTGSSMPQEVSGASQDINMSYADSYANGPSNVSTDSRFFKDTSSMPALIVLGMAGLIITAFMHNSLSRQLTMILMAILILYMVGVTVYYGWVVRDIPVLMLRGFGGTRTKNAHGTAAMVASIIYFAWIYLLVLILWSAFIK